MSSTLSLFSFQTTPFFQQIFSQKSSRTKISFSKEKNIIPECLEPIRQDNFIAQMRQLAPDFFEKKYSIGMQPNLQSEDQLSMEVFQPGYEIIWNAGNQLAIDPRVLVVLSEQSTRAITQPEQLPGYPFFEIEDQAISDNFQIEFFTIGTLLSNYESTIRQARIASEYSAQSLALFDFWQINGQPELSLDEKISHFKQIFYDFFGVDPTSCQEENSL